MHGIAGAALERPIGPEKIERNSTERLFRDVTAEVAWSGIVGGGSLAVSGGVHRICGFTPAEILEVPGHIWFVRAHPDDLPRLEDAYHLLVTTGATFHAEYRWQHQDGSWLWLRSRAVLRATDSAIVDAVFVDITAQKRLEEQVRQLQKIDAVGQFTSGIAHDFNNLLAVIMANATLLVEALPPGDARRDDAEAIADATQRAATLTGQLMALTRRRVFASRVIDANQIVGGVEKMVRRVLGQNIDLSMELSPAVGSVRADAGLLEQVLLNLVLNARDAMPDGGKLSLRTSQVMTGAAAPGLASGAPARFVRITVSDTGCGMDSATRRRIFEPFFTTKPHGRGTGLGLSTCFEIVTQAGGTVRVDSERGIGSVFEVTLPMINAVPEAAVPSAAAATAADATAGTETILVIEDNPEVRALVRKMLDRQGYRVLTAVDGQDALAILHSRDDEIDLVLCDVVMPDLSGTQVVSRVQARSRGTRALFMSGHTTDSLVNNGTLQTGHAFIPKPFTSAALARKVREVLDA